MYHIARLITMSILVLWFARPVIAQQLVSQQILEPASPYHYDHSLCVWTLPPCAEDGTCLAHGFVATSPTPNSPVRMEVRMGRRPGSPKRAGYWHIWGYIIDATGRQYKTGLFLETPNSCVSVRIGPGGDPDQVRILLRTEDDAVYKTRRIVKGMGTQPYTASRVGAWLEGSEPPPEEDLHVEVLYYTDYPRPRTLGTLREVGLERGEPHTGGFRDDLTIIPFLAPAVAGNS